MNTTTDIQNLRRLALAVALAGTTWTLAAQTEGGDPSQAGLVGDRYFSVTLDYVSFDAASVDDGFGATFRFNYPVTDAIDLVASYSYLGNDVDLDFEGSPLDANLDQHALAVGANFHRSLGRGRGFIGAGLGLAKLGVDIPDLGSDSETESFYTIGAGYELPIGDRLALTPFVSWTDFLDSDLDAGAVTYGVDLEVRFGGSASVIGSLMVDDDSNVGLSAGMAFRF